MEYDHWNSRQNPSRSLKNLKPVKDNMELHLPAKTYEAKYVDQNRNNINISFLLN